MDKNNKIDYVRMTAGNDRILDVLKFAKDQEIKWQELEKQTKFAQEHLNLKNCYLTDVDGIVFNSTENEFYMQYTYDTTNKPMISKFIEVKYDATSYFQKMVKKEIPPSSQIQAYCSLLDDVNKARSINNEPEVKLYMILQTQGDYPLHVFEVYDFLEIEFDYIQTVSDEEEYK
ncbi:hypothetical protein [Eudoraea adriatica]|uniref:hypothetical protein n=1 Tax=Eudoraea adriatica TaxID=446681 RepID=UPI000367064B|nr:hypothetical protein [Eudoraea adriatica]